MLLATGELERWNRIESESKRPVGSSSSHKIFFEIVQAFKITAHKRTVPYQLLTFPKMDNENREPFRAETNRPTST